MRNFPERRDDTAVDGHSVTSATDLSDAMSQYDTSRPRTSRLDRLQRQHHNATVELGSGPPA